MFSRLNRSCSMRLAAGAQCRYLNIHEFQSKAVLRANGAKTEFGIPCKTLEEVETAVNKIKTDKKVVKSQILAGGRGKGTFTDGFQGGVHVCDGSAAAVECAKKMLGNTLVTKQTGPKGQKVRNLFITEAVSGIKRELYLALILDAKSTSPMFIGSAEGGTSIEEIAAKNPEKIENMKVNVLEGLDNDACFEFAESLGFSGLAAEKAVEQMKALYSIGKAKDCTQVEINPLVELENGDVMCIDAKLSFDDNAKFRQKDIFEMEDEKEVDSRELEAKQFDLNYVALEGNVGCLANGAGLAMSTMDVIVMSGGKPANFLDVGGSSNEQQIIGAINIITHDPNVKAILVNIFGGIMSCEVIAKSIVAAAEEIKHKNVPFVVRLSGNKEQEGKEILSKSDLAIHPAETLGEAAKMACELAK